MNKYIVTYKTLALSNSGTECVRNVAIAADYYSVAANGAAHFYRHNFATEKNELVATLTEPVTISIEGDEGVTDPVSFLASVIKDQREAAERLEKQDKILEEIKSRASAEEVQKYGENWYERKGFPPGTFTSPPKPEIPVVNGRRIVIRYMDAEGVVRKYAVRTDQDPEKPEVCIDLRPWTDPNWPKD